MLAADREVVHNEAFNVGRDEDVVQIRTIAEAVAERTGAPVTFAEGASADKRDYRVDFTKINEVLPGFSPVWTVAAGIDELAEDMQRLGITQQQFTQTFVRLEQIHRLKSAGVLDDLLRRTGPTSAS